MVLSDQFARSGQGVSVFSGVCGKWERIPPAPPSFEFAQREVSILYRGGAFWQLVQFGTPRPRITGETDGRIAKNRGRTGKRARIRPLTGAAPPAARLCWAVSITGYGAVEPAFEEIAPICPEIGRCGAGKCRKSGIYRKSLRGSLRKPAKMQMLPWRRFAPRAAF